MSVCLSVCLSGYGDTDNRSKLKTSPFDLILLNIVLSHKCNLVSLLVSTSAGGRLSKGSCCHGL
jgi:hypothetical protein